MKWHGGINQRRNRRVIRHHGQTQSMAAKHLKINKANSIRAWRKKQQRKRSISENRRQWRRKYLYNDQCRRMAALKAKDSGMNALKESDGGIYRRINKRRNGVASAAK